MNLEEASRILDATVRHAVDAGAPYDSETTWAAVDKLRSLADVGEPRFERVLRKIRQQLDADLAEAEAVFAGVDLPAVHETHGSPDEMFSPEQMTAALKLCRALRKVTDRACSEFLGSESAFEDRRPEA